MAQALPRPPHARATAQQSAPPAAGPGAGRPAVRRRAMGLRLAGLLAALALCPAAGPALAAEPDLSPLKGRQADGRILLVRHALAPGGGDPPGFRLGDCSTQRNLSDEGRAQAVRFGAALRSAGVVVGAVWHSQWCRTRDTAELAFPGRAQPEPAFNSFFEDRSREPEATAAARERLRSWRGPGVLVVVTHQVNITALTGIFPASGEAVLLKPDGQGGFTVLGRYTL